MKKIILLFFISFAFVCKAQTSGDVAQNFGTAYGFNNIVRSIAVQNDGKILMGGDFITYRGVTENRIIRLNPDGSKDTTFVTGTGFNNTVYSIAVQNDGKILVGGAFITYNGVTENRVIRLNPDGSKDTSFVTGTGFNNVIYSIALQTDGKILVGGGFTTFNGGSENRIIRLNPDGSKDTTFVAGMGFNNNVQSIALQTDGKIIVGGDFTTYNGITENKIIRLNSDGSKDTSFVTGAGFNNTVWSIAVQTDGKILLSGAFITYNGVTENRIIRLNPDGSKETSFVTGTGFNNNVQSIALQTDGKILVGGGFITYKGITENHIIRLNPDGSKDTTFVTGTGFENTVYSFAVQTDGKTLVVGNFTTYNGVLENRIIRLNADGSKDTNFVTGTGFNNTVWSITVQVDGKILVGGDFTTYKGITENRIIRLNPDGSKDTTFVTGTGFNNTVRTIAVQTDGKILVGGNFTTYKGITENRIIRLNSDGSKDTTFVTGTGFDGIVMSIAVQTDGKTLVGGQFGTYKGLTGNYIIRLNPDGAKDASFVTGFNNVVYSIALQTDGKILVGGPFTTYKGLTENYIIRLNPDGSKDASFVTGSGFSNAVVSINVQTDGKILLGGQFTTYKGVTENYIIRLNPDGSKDTTFVTGTGFNAHLWSIAVQTDGKILVGGNFTIYNGVAENFIIRLNADGSKDTTFVTGTGFNGSVLSIALQVDGKILVGGGFTTYKGSSDSAYLIALYPGIILANESFTTPTAFSLYPNPVKNSLNISSLTNEVVLAVKIYDLQGKLLHENSSNTINVSTFPTGLYLIKITTEKGETTKKFIKE